VSSREAQNHFRSLHSAIEATRSVTAVCLSSEGGPRRAHARWPLWGITPARPRHSDDAPDCLKSNEERCIGTATYSATLSSTSPRATTLHYSSETLPSKEQSSSSLSVSSSSESASSRLFFSSRSKRRRSRNSSVSSGSCGAGSLHRTRPCQLPQTLRSTRTARPRVEQESSKLEINRRKRRQDHANLRRRRRRRAPACGEPGPTHLLAQMPCTDASLA
jgi:hypothetical protein